MNSGLSRREFLASTGIACIVSKFFPGTAYAANPENKNLSQEFLEKLREYQSIIPKYSPSNSGVFYTDGSDGRRTYHVQIKEKYKLTSVSYTAPEDVIALPEGGKFNGPIDVENGRLTVVNWHSPMFRELIDENLDGKVDKLRFIWPGFPYNLDTANNWPDSLHQHLKPENDIDVRNLSPYNISSEQKLYGAFIRALIRNLDNFAANQNFKIQRNK